MGGKSPKIVFNDADLDPSLPTSLPHGILSVLPFIYQSFLCSRIPILQLEPQVVLARVSLSSLYNEFLERFSGKQAKSVRFGDPLKFAEGSYQGPQVSRAQFDVCLSLFRHSNNNCK